VISRSGYRTPHGLVAASACAISPRCVGGGPPHPAVGNRRIAARVSARTGQGLEALRAHLKSSVGYQSARRAARLGARAASRGAACARARSVEVGGADQLTERRAGELVAEELRSGPAGARARSPASFTTEDLLGRIFASFCIGK
jgi:tRNA modification GTPase